MTRPIDPDSRPDACAAFEAAADPAPGPGASPGPGPGRMPPWLKVSLPRGPEFGRTARTVAGGRLHTVCQSARCPNIFECFGKKTATFLILGSVCTRNCAFCNITPGRPAPPDPDEPRRVAEAVRELGLRHAVLTSVTRDDLPDGGAGHFAATLAAIGEALPGLSTETLIPDFGGDPEALAAVLTAGPLVLNHNVETAPRLYPAIRPQAVYGRSLALLSRAARFGGVAVKSGFMVGLGETRTEIRALLDDLAASGVGLVTVGQYLPPTRGRLRPERYVSPEEFDEIAAEGRERGIGRMFCGPFVRSSYHAADLAGPEKPPVVGRPEIG